MGKNTFWRGDKKKSERKKGEKLYLRMASGEKRVVSSWGKKKTNASHQNEVY